MKHNRRFTDNLKPICPIRAWKRFHASPGFEVVLILLSVVFLMYFIGAGVS